MTNKELVESAYKIAKEQYAKLDINTDVVLDKMKDVILF